MYILSNDLDQDKSYHNKQSSFNTIFRVLLQWWFIHNFLLKVNDITEDIAWYKFDTYYNWITMDHNNEMISVGDDLQKVEDYITRRHARDSPLIYDYNIIPIVS